MTADAFPRLAAHIKVIVVGNGAVGKTSMIQRFCKGGFGNDYIKTLGVDYVEKQDYRVDSIDDSVTMNVWDTAGQEEYDAVTAQYYRGGHRLLQCRHHGLPSFGLRKSY